MIINNNKKLESELVPQSDIEAPSLMEIMTGLFSQKNTKKQSTINPSVQWNYEPGSLPPSKQSENPIDLI